MELLRLTLCTVERVLQHYLDADVRYVVLAYADMFGHWMLHRIVRAPSRCTRMREVLGPDTENEP